MHALREADKLAEEASGALALAETQPAAESAAKRRAAQGGADATAAESRCALQAPCFA